MGAIGVLARKQKTQKGYIKRTFQREGLKEGCKLKYHHQYNFKWKNMKVNQKIQIWPRFVLLIKYLIKRKILFF